LNLSLTEIARAVNGKLSGDDTGPINEVVIDDRKVRPGDLFVCVAGERFDGHDFANQAERAGAAALLCSRELPVDAPRILVEDTRTALLDLAGHYRRKCPPEAVIGVTGSVGKTTTKDMIAAVISQKHPTIATVGNLNNEIGLPRMILSNRWQEHSDQGPFAAVLEMGMNHSGEISRLSRCAAPTIGLITNIGVSHIENLGSRSGILAAKLEMLDGMPDGAPLLLNGDNDMLSDVTESISNKRPIKFYGVTNKKSVCRASNIEQKGTSIFFNICYNNNVWPVEVPAAGMHNVYNALAAFLCGMEAGVAPEQAIRGLRGYVPDAGRQNIRQSGGITIIDDCYNASPDSIKAALAVLKDLPNSGRKIAVLGDMLELGDYSGRGHADCGRFLAELKIDALFAYGEAAADYITGVGEAGKNVVETFHYTDKSALADDLSGYIREGDAVLFKASRGMRLEEVVKCIMHNS